MSTHDEFDALAAADAIDAASDDEHRALHAHIETCADCRRAYDDYVEAAAAFARGLDPVTAPAHIRGAIMDAVNEFNDEDDIERSRLGDSRWWLGIAATIFLALWGWREVSMRAAREHIASRDAEIRTLTEQNAILQQRSAKLNTELAALAAADTKTIALTGQQVAPKASAKVFLEPSNRRAIVVFANLPDNPNDKSYQLWIIRADQAKPQSAGVFDASPNGTATVSVENLPVDTEIKAMAVTLEPKGGVQQPTNSNFIVMGKS